MKRYCILQIRKHCVLLTLILFVTGHVAAEEGRISSVDTLVSGIGKVNIVPLMTIGESIAGYVPPGIPDGLGLFRDEQSHRLFMNHELGAGRAYAYSLRNGTRLTGARISALDLDPGSGRIISAAIAYHTIYDRQGREVRDPEQLEGGLRRLCSGRAVYAGQYGFEDDLFFSGEEADDGTEFVLNVRAGELWAIPALGRAAWENISPVAMLDNQNIGLLIGDDRPAAPLYLFVGKKHALGDNSLLDRNGLAQGQLHCWAAANNDLTPEAFHGTGATRAGRWLPMQNRQPDKAGHAGYDLDGYLLAEKLRQQARHLGCFQFSKPEDVHENPASPGQAVFASTGRGRIFPADNWGTLYLIDVHTAQLKILYDGDDAQFRDRGIRNPDNLTWAADGYIYVQEDRATRMKRIPGGCAANTACRDQAFGGLTGMEASIWRFDPDRAITGPGELQRLAVVNRKARLPDGQTDRAPGDLGNWETSGIIDASQYIQRAGNETLLIGTVQAHSVRGGAISSNELVEGGQLFMMTVPRNEK